jgi:hypothetical protein
MHEIQQPQTSVRFQKADGGRQWVVFTFSEDSSGSDGLIVPEKVYEEGHFLLSLTVGLLLF